MEPQSGKQENSCFSIYQKEQLKFEVKSDTINISLANAIRQEKDGLLADDMIV